MLDVVVVAILITGVSTLVISLFIYSRAAYFNTARGNQMHQNKDEILEALRQNRVAVESRLSGLENRPVSGPHYPISGSRPEAALLDDVTTTLGTAVEYATHAMLMLQSARDGQYDYRTNLRVWQRLFEMLYERAEADIASEVRASTAERTELN